MIYILFIVLLIISILIYHIYKKYYDNKKLTKFEDMDNILPRPFVSIKDAKNNKINCVLVSHPFTRQTGEDLSRLYLVFQLALNVQYSWISGMSGRRRMAKLVNKKRSLDENILTKSDVDNQFQNHN